MATLTQQRCRNHGQREAVARCPECETFFCRECVTEHDGRVICQSCLTTLLAKDEKRQSGWAKFLVRGVGALAGLMMAWLFFYLLGQVLISIPSEFHDGSVFKPD